MVRIHPVTARLSGISLDRPACADKLLRVLTLEPLGAPRGIVLFGAGAGGDPRRYRDLLDGFVDAGHVVLAPTNERFDPRTVTTEQLQGRVESLISALADYHHADLPIVASGHSVGGWAALCLAGAQPWSRDGQPIPVAAAQRVTRLVLFAPTVGWFQAPGALSRVEVPIIVHAGENDMVTPADTATLLRAAPGTVSIQVHENVGHYDFMTELPPNMTPTSRLDHAVFLRELRRLAGTGIS